MVGGSLISDSLGPLSGLAGPSLFPRTMRASTDAPFPSDHKDLDSVHHFMKSLVSKSPERLLEEAKAICDGGTELLSSNFAAFATSSGIGDVAPVRGNEKLQERRPGLGRKRARFSLKPNSSQTSVSLEPSLNVDQLQDPEEFFSAVERIENARKEIERQKGGGIAALEDNNLSQNTRRRRPGLLGKAVAYKHRFSSVLSENEDTFISFQKPLEPSVPSGPNHESLQETNDSDVESQDIDVAGSIKKTENRVNKILDELLSTNSEDLDGHGAVSLLKDRLQIKPIELSTLSMPDFHDVGRTDYMSLGRNVSKRRRTSLEAQNLVKRTSKEAPVSCKQMEQSPANSLASPTPPKSPFASISLLKKRILQSNPLRDPFSPLNVDLSTPRDLSSVSQVDNKPDDVNGLERFNISNKMNPLTEGVISKPKVSDSASEKVMMGGSVSLADQFMDENSSRESPYVDVMPNGSHSNLRVHHDSYNMDGLSTEDTKNDDLMDGSDRIRKNVEDGPRQVVCSPTKHGAADYSTKSLSEINGRPSQMAKNVEEMPSAAFSAQMHINIEESTDPENLNSDLTLFDEAHPATTEECTMGMQPSMKESNSKQETEKLPSRSGQQKRKRSAVGKRERKTLSCRPSIADAGTSFETGVRRSKRIKMRPLEYWKGERFLYGRVHDSVKLIGLRYISPAKGDGKLKVKPYVSHEYNELLELAAKH